MSTFSYKPICLAAISAVLMYARPGAAQTPGIATERVATGFVRPVFCSAPDAEIKRLFVVEQGGRIHTLKLQKPGKRSLFLDISAQITSDGERGLLGLAFHPRFETNRRFYVCFTGTVGETRVVEFRAKPGAPEQADPASARLILTFSQPQSNHNGGWMDFGPDGFLYIASGDGGGGNDTGTGHTAGTGNAQDITANLLGKILRIDVDRDDFPADPNRNYGNPATNPFVDTTGDDEIWAWGLRNPWRCGFDRQTGDLYIGDVGQGAREEINFQSHLNGGGRNYGWRLREGTIATPTMDIGGAAPPGAIEPVYDYTHGTGPLQGRAVTGGYVYRGPITALRGTYFFADFSNSRIWSFQTTGTSITQFTDWTIALRPDVGTINNVSSFGEDGLGNLYLVDYDGEIFRITQTTASQPLQERLRSAIVRTLTQPAAGRPNHTPARDRSAE